MAPPTTGRAQIPDEVPHADGAALTDTVGTRSGLAAVARRVHFIAGLAVAPFLAVMCLTGLANAFTPQIVNAVHGQELFADNTAGEPGPASEQVAAALSQHPQATLKAVLPPAEPGRTTGVVLSTTGLPDIDRFSDEDLTVYVNPHTNRVQGELTTVKDRTPTQVWLRNVHGNLHLGQVGRVYSEFATSWVPVIVVCGLVLRLAHGRRSGTVTPRARTRARHSTWGLCLGLGLVALAVTGFSQSHYVGDRFDQVLANLSSSEPELDTDAVAVPPGAQPVGVDQALEAAHADGLRGELTVTAPTEPGEVFAVAETGDGWPVQNDRIAVDPHTGQVIDRVAFEDFPLLAKLNVLGIKAHDGTLFGIANQVVVSTLALGTLVLTGFAYLMWWRRRPTGAAWPSPPGPVWRALPRAALIGAVVLGAILAWAMPVLGVSLIGFLVLDSIIRAAERRPHQKW
ncbi:PepSY-associated TM helix domain-containing protein [Saccharopolyspora tripterygii]